MNGEERLAGLQTKSDRIRSLAAKGMPTADIARLLGIRYQHAYNVLRAGGGAIGSSHSRSSTVQLTKPPLTVQILRDGGFDLAGRWTTNSNGELLLEGHVSLDGPGVYAFAEGDLVLYVGVANMGLRKRLYFYSRPGVSQTTSIRIKGMLLEQLKSFQSIEVYTHSPSDMVVNGMPISGSAGMEHGLIRTYSIPWNIRGA